MVLGVWLAQCPDKFWPKRLLHTGIVQDEIAPVWYGLAAKLRRDGYSCMLGSQKDCDQHYCP